MAKYSSSFQLFSFIYLFIFFFSFSPIFASIELVLNYYNRISNANLLQKTFLPPVDLLTACKQPYSTIFQNLGIQNHTIVVNKIINTSLLCRVNGIYFMFHLGRDTLSIEHCLMQVA